VTLRIEEARSEALDLWMASWVPGSYLMREYAGQVTQLTAESEGTPLATTKTDKSTWRVDASSADRAEVRYRVFAPELTVRTADITADHAFIHSPSVFLIVAGREEEPCSVTVETPEGWDIATSLVHVGEHYLAEDADRLLDCPIEVGHLERRSFEAAGHPHEMVIHGTGNHDVDRIVADAAKICDYENRLFGETPFDRYLFLLFLTHDRGGGLEHRDCSALAWPKLGFRPDKEYHDFLTLIAHEYFHVWNVKRIRPQVLWNYRYDREVYTRLLWVFEGITSYYDELIPMRVGCYAPHDYGRFFSKNLTEERNRPGREIQHLADSSFDTWIKLYRPTADTLNSQSNYYQRGALVALLLDLFLRSRTDDAKSLDDVMRYLWTETYKKGRGVEEDEFGRIVEQATGVSVDDFLQRHVWQTGDLDFDDALQRVGLRILPPEKEKPWVGATIRDDRGESRLERVRVDGPAHDAGWMAEDVIVALDGHRVRGDLEKRIGLYEGGERATWTGFRRDRLVEGSIRFGTNPQRELRVRPVEEPSDAQKSAFRAWTGRELSEWSTDEHSDES
jgi:predicted metalloprotease with PDZ domain